MNFNDKTKFSKIIYFSLYQVCSLQCLTSLSKAFYASVWNNLKNSIYMRLSNCFIDYKFCYKTTWKKEKKEEKRSSLFTVIIFPLTSAEGFCHETGTRNFREMGERSPIVVKWLERLVNMTIVNIEKKFF